MARGFKAGEWVEVRDAESILRTLGPSAQLQGMPFMPEMLKFCGKRFRVSKVAHKTCDTANKTGGRWVEDSYHLENLRCDGAAHGGCQATCLLFFKGAWLRKVDEPDSGVKANGPGCTPEALQAATRTPTPQGAPIRYSCQTTLLFDFTRPLKWWDLRQYWRDVSSGNVKVGALVRVLFLSWFRALMRLKVGYGLTSRLYQSVHRALVGLPAPLGDGRIPLKSPTPGGTLDLEPGELVTVKSHDQIRDTLSVNNKNRGLWFDQEYVRFCGTQQRVSHRVQRILDERTGEMIEMKNPCIVLEGVQCDACYSTTRLFCPRGIMAYWREAWLDRAAPKAQAGDSGRAQA
jgi:hypothetical protein